MVNVFIVIGLILLFICGVIITSYGVISIESDGSSIKNVLLLLIGIIMLALWIHLIKRTSDSNHKFYEETHPTEIVTSIPPQIDTTISIKNGISDTTYTYIFNNWFKKPEYKDMLEYIDSVPGCSYIFME